LSLLEREEEVEGDVVIDGVRARIDPVPQIGVVAVNTGVGGRRSLSDVRASTGVQEIWVGNDGSERGLGSAITCGGTGHIGHLDTEVVEGAQRMRSIVVAEGRRCRPYKGRKACGYERAARHAWKLREMKRM
jgi:hypothetical protein